MRQRSTDSKASCSHTHAVKESDVIHELGYKGDSSGILWADECDGSETDVVLQASPHKRKKLSVIYNGL
jgi:hypothetical protein